MQEGEIAFLSELYSLALVRLISVGRPGRRVEVSPGAILDSELAKQLQVTPSLCREAPSA